MDPLTDLGIAVATEATTSSLAKIKKHIGYLYKYKQNVKSLEVAAKKLDSKRIDASRFIEDTNRKLKDVSSTTVHWQSEADQLHQKAQKIFSGNKISWSRYSTSKHAWKMAQKINEDIQTAPNFGTVFDRPAPKLGPTFDLKGFMHFGSRASVVNEVWEALKDEKVRMCSISGMGGTGKTLLVKKLIQRVESDHLFDKVVMVTVSQNPNPRKIRGNIASSLELKIGSEELETSNKLIEWLLINDKSILLILDDVWEELDFEAIGLPRAKLKILLTSRKKDVCQRMGSEPNCVINVLTNEEAWGLFKEIAMESIEKLKLHDTARKVADECGGLPIVIVTLATALKHEAKATWNDSLLKLQKSNLLSIAGMEKVYSRIQLSYDLLNDHEAQSCFRLCCLFPEDHNIPVEYLVCYGKGLQLFENVVSMSDARDRVESIIHKVKKSFLLLDGEDDDSVKMHDILRDFAISISSKDRHPYIVGCEQVMEKWPETSQYENCSAISFVCNKINEHPLDLRCPKLELLHLILKDDGVGLPIGIFEGLKELKVLVLQVPLLFQSLSMLTKLRTLIINEISNDWEDFERSKIGDLLGHGDLKDLEILAFATNRSCYAFPEKIGLLCNLRHLKFSRVEFNYMPPGVLSKLVKLEELDLSPKFTSWGSEEEGGRRMNASLDEIESLPLSTLKIAVGKCSILSENLVKSLTRFHICMGTSDWRTYDSNAELEVFDMDASDVRVGWISGLLRKCESLKLSYVRNLKNLMCLQFSEDNGFPQLKDMDLFGCNEMEDLVDKIAERIPSFFLSQLETLCLTDMDSLKEIWHEYAYFSKIEPIYFSNLSVIKIYDCPKLKHLFPLSVATELRQLHCILIMDCEEMEEILYIDQVDNGNQIMEENIAKTDEKEVDHTIIFPQLKTLRLRGMLKLRILYDGNHAIELPSLEELLIDQCTRMEGLSYGSFNAPRLEGLLINNFSYDAGGEDLNEIVKEMAGTGNDIEEDDDDDVDNDNDNDDEIHQITN
ncbi:probable disease resistance protein At4g27220 [Euphorbia lathyris]|uniref:probable disease resistance protein At4g27220 n=1 Tax=Euphorbia lathyris TaxID=212925 RepID=UPI0033141939